MTDPYYRLAQRLDELPHGFPPDESGVEIKILQKIFSPEDAETALLLRAIPETAETIATSLESADARELGVEALLGTLPVPGEGQRKRIGAKLRSEAPAAEIVRLIGRALSSQGRRATTIELDP